ncbi:hypothetical protein B5G38_13225 [Gemmiger sp. An87]|nr:hypothetical protein B5G38_13225 [Gemmiger sp. An87]
MTFSWGPGRLRCLIRGGNWNNGSNAGVFNANLNNPRSNSNSNIGGRSAFRLYRPLWRRFCAGQEGYTLRGAIGAQAKRGPVPFPVSGKKCVLPRRRKRHARPWRIYAGYRKRMGRNMQV